MADYTLDDLAALSPRWESVFGESLPMGFEITPAQVPMLRRCLRERSHEPLEEYIESLGDDIDY